MTAPFVRVWVLIQSNLCFPNLSDDTFYDELLSYSKAIEEYLKVCLIQIHIAL